MLKRLRQLEISLAAKCQLIFGAAVVLIIGAALAVPWQRMEQLTNQLDERSARTLTDYAVAEHAARYSARREGVGAAAVERKGVIAAQPATTQPLGDEGFVAPRLILAGQGRNYDELTSFERKAVARLRSGDREWYFSGQELDDGTKRYRFARVESSCVRCHAPVQTAAATNAGSTQP